MVSFPEEKAISCIFYVFIPIFVAVTASDLTELMCSKGSEAGFMLVTIPSSLAAARSSYVQTGNSAGPQL